MHDLEDNAIRSRPRTIDEYCASEQPLPAPLLVSLLVPLPDEPFETGRLFTLRVDRYRQISVRTHRYSVPVRLIGPAAWSSTGGAPSSSSFGGNVIETGTGSYRLATTRARAEQQ
uniref:Mu transposase domain-containing protein n=1 Tax=Streptomyces aureocirculatus TaxID=67275 RepID=UPI0004C725A0|nr:hypothetical protein [Streptomyces aureocirculatus]